MAKPNKNNCESFINKYSQITGLDSIKSQKLHLFLKDVTDIYSNTDWRFWDDITNHPKNHPINVANIHKINQNVERMYNKAIGSNDPKLFLEFRDSFYFYKDFLIKERDSLANLDNKSKLYLSGNRKAQYLERIGFRPSIILYEKAKPDILQAARPMLLETLKTDETRLNPRDINDFATQFMEFNPFSNENHIKYLKLALTIEDEYSVSSLLALFDLQDKYSTPLQMENFQNSTEFDELITKKKLLKSEELSKIYMIDLDFTSSKGELSLGDLFAITNYDLEKKGFTIYFNTYDLPGSSSIDYFSTVLPKVVNRVFFENIPFTNLGKKLSSLGGYSSGTDYNILFLPTDTNIGSKIEESGSRLRIKILFQLNEDLQYTTTADVWPYLKANNCKLIIYDVSTNEILYSKLYKK